MIFGIHVLNKLLKNKGPLLRRTFKVCILGATSEVGKSLSLWLKLEPLVTSLVIYDKVASLENQQYELSLIDSKSQVLSYVDPIRNNSHKNLEKALIDSALVIITSGYSYSDPKQTTKDLFKLNKKIVHPLIEVFASACPEALLLIATNPVTALVPMASGILSQKNAYNPKRLFGITSSEAMRSKQLLYNYITPPADELNLPVVGGNTPATVVPLFTQCQPKIDLSLTETREFIQECKKGPVKLKHGDKNIQFCSILSAYRSIVSLLRARTGIQNITETFFVQSDLTTSPFFSSPVLLDAQGVDKIFGFGQLNTIEHDLLTVATNRLSVHYELGVANLEDL